MSKAMNLTGLKFGKLTVIHRIANNQDGRTMWHCLCECGREVDVLGKSLTGNNTKTCGCSHKQRDIKSNKYKVSGDTVTMYTSNGESFNFDIDILDKVIKYTWYIGNNGYVVCRYNSLLLHRFVLDCKGNEIVDHINHNKLDNRKSNLRICSRAENNRNHILSKSNTTGITGVCFDKSKNKYRAYIGVNGKQKTLGYFNDIESAIKEREKAESLYYKEYACKS